MSEEMINIAQWASGVILSVVLYAIPKDRLLSIFRQPNLDSFMKKVEVRDKAKLAIIDDDLDSFPISFIRTLGYEVDTYESISFADSVKITNYDMVFLDVKGVIQEDPKEGGAKFIKILKEARKYLPVVAVSSGKFSPAFNDYFKMSDSTINKPISQYDIRETIEELKNDFFDFPKLVFELKKKIRKLPVSKRQKIILNRLITKYLTDEKSKQNTFNYIHQVATVDSEEIIESINIIKDRLEND